jgi:hypothetical protein
MLHHRNEKAEKSQDYGTIHSIPAPDLGIQAFVQRGTALPPGADGSRRGNLFEFVLVLMSEGRIICF